MVTSSALVFSALIGMAQTPRQQLPVTLDLNLQKLSSPAFELELSQTDGVALGLKPQGQGGFDFLPSDRLIIRNRDGFAHLGDLSFRYRAGGQGDWQEFSSFKIRLKPTPGQAAADHRQDSIKGEGFELEREWKSHQESVLLTFKLTNTGSAPLEVGSLAMAMPFNNLIEGRDLEEAHAKCSFTDPYIGMDAGYLRIAKLSGTGPVLMVTPINAPLEAWNLVREPMRPNQVFEGVMEWMIHTKAFAEKEWKGVKQWNEPTESVLKPGESKSFGVKLSLAPSIRQIDETLHRLDLPVTVTIPGTILPMDQAGKVFIKSRSDVEKISCDPPAALEWKANNEGKKGWKGLTLKAKKWGRARLTLTYSDGKVQTIHYMVTKPASQAVADLGRFQTTKAWFDDKTDPFGRAPSPISYDREADKQVTQDARVWIAGLGDEGGNGSWLSLVMKSYGQPDASEVTKLEAFVNQVLWGRLQYSEGPNKYGVRKSVFYYDPKTFPDYPYDKDRNWSTWTSWNKEHAGDIGRGYNYPHVVAAYWSLYQIARSHPHLVKTHDWEWYLNQAFHTAEFLTSKMPDGSDKVGYWRLGLMEGTIFLRLLEDLQREGWSVKADLIKERMLERAMRWKHEAYPFGSEMAWDSTGQEEVYAWCRYFGFEDKAQVTLNSILAYTPTLPHWGYDGNARRYWDFLYGGKLSRIERQLHHYGSGLNAIPLLTEFRDHPDDLYLLRAGYAGMMGAISAIDQEGFASAAFHSFPSTLKWDAYSGDYGPNFFGHALNTGAYLVKTSDFGWQAFGGEAVVNGSKVTLKPQDSFRRRVFLAPLGLLVSLDSGVIDQVELDVSSGKAKVRVAEGSGKAKSVRLRLEQTVKVPGVGRYLPEESLVREAGACLVPLTAGRAEVNISPV